MKTHLAALALLAMTGLALAAPEQVGDLRIGSATYAGGTTYFDPGFAETTRGVSGAPVQLPSAFTGTSQNPTDPGDPATDIGIRTFTTATQFRNVNRYGVDPDGPGGAGGPQNIGAVQYEIDLAPLEDHLASSGETLTELEVRLVLALSDNSKDYDIYLSYTNAAEGITRTSLTANDPGAHYNGLWLPAQGGNPGDVINGTHKILNIQQQGNLDQSTDLAALYAAGVRKLNLIVVVPSFFSTRTITVNEFSGIHVNTSGLASLTQVGDLRLDPGSFSGRTFYYDHFGPIPTQPVAGAPFDLPSRLSGTSQNQGGNLPLTPVGLYSFDGVAAGTNTASGNGATVTGYGAAGLHASTTDGFQYTAWKASGDFTVDVKLASLASLESGARAGLMVRGSRAADSAHAFVGVRESGEAVVVTRDVDGTTATLTTGAAVTLPQWLRIVRTGDLFEFFLSADGAAYSPATPASETITFTDPVLVGMAVSSGSDAVDAVAVFEELSETLAATTADIGLQTYSSATTIRTLNRFAFQSSVGVVQWALDLSPLDGYLAGNGLNLDALEVRLIADASDEGREFDVYLSYTDTTASIALAGIDPAQATVNFLSLFLPAIGASANDIVGGTHKVLLPYTAGDIDLTEDLLALYDAGVRDLNLIVTTDTFYSARSLAIQAGSGLFIETSTNAALEIVDVVLDGLNSELDLTIDGLSSGATYHLQSSTTLTGFTAIAGSDFVAAGTQDSVSTTVDVGAEPVLFVRVAEGAAP